MVIDKGILDEPPVQLLLTETDETFTLVIIAPEGRWYAGHASEVVGICILAIGELVPSCTGEGDAALGREPRTDLVVGIEH